MKRKFRIWFIAAIVFVILIVGYNQLIPSYTSSNLFEGKENTISYRGTFLESKATMRNNDLFIPIKAIQDSFDPYAFLESDGSMTLVTPTNIIEHFPANFASVSQLSSLYSLGITKNPATGVIYIPDPNAQKGTITTSATVRSKSSIRGSIITHVAKGDEVEVIEIHEKWVKVQSSSGFFGYITKESIQIKEVNLSSVDQRKEKAISVVWDQGGYTGSAALAGIDVLSPVWFSLADSIGSIDSSAASSIYVQDAHSRGIQVWALFNNNFKPQMTHDALVKFSTRKAIITSIMSSVNELNLDGINMDFENVFLKDKALYAQFVREMAAVLHREGKTITADVGVKSSDETWSMFFDRKAISSFVDHLMLMAYDQTPEASTTAGSVASLPWTEESIVSLLEEVPASKVILSIPFYTRVWRGEDSVKGATLSYKFTEEWITKRDFTPELDPDSGQNVIDEEDKETGIRTRVWFEDETSMKKRMDLIDKYNLAGVAVWSRNHADEDTWKTFFSIFNK